MTSTLVKGAMKVNHRNGFFMSSMKYRTFDLNEAIKVTKKLIANPSPKRKTNYDEILIVLEKVKEDYEKYKGIIPDTTDTWEMPVKIFREKKKRSNAKKISRNAASRMEFVKRFNESLGRVNEIHKRGDTL